MTERETKSELKEVLTRVVDSADGYEHSAKESEDGRFAVMFRERAGERRGFAEEIRNHLRGLGEEVADDGSILAGAHRAFTSIRDAVTGSDDHSVVEEVERGETRLLSEYDEALNDLPAADPAHGMLERQRQAVQNSLNDFRSMKTR
ncbi:MAG: PA2169 family four-helix-bundle protein [Parvularcula sp.]|jgi:uncharacterized protein (TIGR02284 family)|nr:PA2169 family four-helix-bundle protein [Parvularcula sp.]